MLVLTRKAEESIRIGDKIRVTVVRLERGRVRLGIEAPDYLPIVRCELDEPIDAGTESDNPSESV